MRNPTPCPRSSTPVFELLEPRLFLDAMLGNVVAVDYLIIAGNDLCPNGQPCEAIHDLAEWKQLKGYRTRVASMSDLGPLATDIGKYIREGINQSGQDCWSTPPQYVLLIGDAAQVPASTGALTEPVYPYAAHVSDNPYADTFNDTSIAEGGDHIPDLALGRIPISTVGNLDKVIGKILKYDRDPDMPGAGQVDWYENALVATCFQGDSSGEEDPVYHFTETAHRIADFLGGDYDYWGEAEDPYDPFNIGYNVEATVRPVPGGTTYSYNSPEFGGRNTDFPAIPAGHRAATWGCPHTHNGTNNIEYSTDINA